MKAFLFSFLAAFGLAGASVAAPAPDFTLPAADGNTYSLSDFTSQTVVLEWTNFGCPFVRKHYDSGNMQQLQADVTDQGVVWLSIVSSAPGKQGYLAQDEAMATKQKEGSNATHLLLDPDGTVGQAYGAMTTPHMFVIKPGREVVYRGAIDSISSPRAEDIPKAENYVVSALDALEMGEAVDPAVTNPYGCSVKY